MNHVLNFENPVKTRICRWPIKVKTNFLVSVLVLFVAVAAMQTFQLETMRSEAKSLDEDINGIRAEQTILREQYALHGNNLSYYFDD